MSETFIKVENLSFAYEADTDSKSIPAVDNISLEIKKVSTLPFSDTTDRESQPLPSYSILYLSPHREK